MGAGFSLRAQISKFETEGFRPQSAAERTLGNVRLGWDGNNDRVVFVLNSINQPSQDPLGLTREQPGPPVLSKSPCASSRLLQPMAAAVQS